MASRTDTAGLPAQRYFDFSDAMTNPAAGQCIPAA